jgi:hypothetical protein
MVRGKVLTFCVALAEPLVACGGESTRHTAPSTAGTPGANGDETPDDAGTTPDDAGTAPDDAGTAPDDAATAPDDAATAPDDAGTAPDDAGPATTLETIDDMDPSDDPDGTLTSGFLWAQGFGNWFVNPPLEGRIADAPVDAIEPPRGTSTQACHVKGTGYAGGVDLWAQLHHPNGTPADLSTYAGFAFWARLGSPSRVLRVGLNQASVFQQVPDASAGDTQVFSVGPAWELFVVQFADISADPTAVISIDFIVGEDGDDFDLWVDDLALVCNGPCTVRE